MSKASKDTKSKTKDTKSMAFVGKLADMVKGVSELGKSVVEQSDSEKYANSVDTLSKGVSDSYEAMRSVIRNSETMSDEEKLKQLQLIADREKETKSQYGQEIRENRENVAKIALEVTKGVLTAGLSFAPSIVKEVKQLGHKDDPLELEENHFDVVDSSGAVVDAE